MVLLSWSINVGTRRKRRIRAGRIISLATLALGLCVARPDASFAFAGVQTNLPVSSLSGWSLCYSDVYSNSGTSVASILTDCDKAHLLLACRQTGSPTLLVAAHAPRADVTFDTGTSNTPHDANGVGWYFSDSYSWGFAPQGDPISRTSCDTVASSFNPSGPDPDQRLCWHSSSGSIQGGWRCGTADSLNSSSAYERLVFETDTLSCGNGALEVGEECDDGNLISGDGCADSCEIEPCYGCSGEPSTCFTLPDASDCDDGLFCNGSDTCSAGTCTIHIGDPCPGGAECNNVCNEATNSCTVSAGTPCTDDGNGCTDDQCDGAGMCVHPDNFASCDDGLFCNGGDYCSGGSCQGHFGDPCIFTSQCNNVCDEPSGQCTPTTGGTPCGDDGNVCTTDQCDGAGACGHPAGPSGVPCPDDGLQCTSDQCNGVGVCAHPPLSSSAPCASDDNECTSDHCDGAGACVHPAVLNGTSCDDSDACTQTDKCQAGDCVGSNLIVCPVPLCHAAGTCDPASGTCTTCPAGYTQGAGGCQKTYAIDVSRLDNLPNFCDGSGTNRYNPCDASAWGFHWTDTGDASVGPVTRVDVELHAGVDCTSGTHTVALNASSVGTYPSNSDCSCVPFPETHVLADVDSSSYVKGGLNTVSVDGLGSCAGISADASGAYALVTVIYDDPPPAILIQTGCRQALKSKLKYRDNANDAKDKINWKWGKGDATTAMEFGNPTASANYRLCVFGETSGTPSLLFEAEVPASSMLWSAVGSTGFKYNDTAASQDGISKMLVRSGGVGKSKIILKGKGAGLSDPALPLPLGTTGLRAQLTNDSSNVCWESEFPIGTVTADAESIKAKNP